MARRNSPDRFRRPSLMLFLGSDIVRIGSPSGSTCKSLTGQGEHSLWTLPVGIGCAMFCKHFSATLPVGMFAQ